MASKNHGLTMNQINTENIIIDILSSVILVIRNFFGLIFYPYRSMRKISQERDYGQILTVFVLVFVYFKFAYFLRSDPYPASFIFLIFSLNLFVMVLFFYLIAKATKPNTDFAPFLFTLTYSLFPTLLWFASNSLLYLLVPPLRTLSFLGKAFSGFYLAYSFSLLVWKLILVYLSLRFSSKFSFFRIFYMFILFLVWFIPYSFLLYRLKIF